MSARDPGAPEPGVIAPTLRAMSRNYSGGHSWDHLDARMCTAAADEIDNLRAQLEEAKAGNHRADETEPTWTDLVRAWKGRAESAESNLDRLTGMKFSDRMHAALVARAEAAEAECARLKSLARLDEALEQAAGELPDGWIVSVCAENGAGWVEMTDPDGERTHIDTDDSSLASNVLEAIEIARTKGGER